MPIVMIYWIDGISQIFVLSELYFRWIIDQSGTKTIMNQVQTLVTQEKELRTKVCVNFFSFLINFEMKFN